MAHPPPLSSKPFRFSLTNRAISQFLSAHGWAQSHLQVQCLALTGRSTLVSSILWPAVSEHLTEARVNPRTSGTQVRSSDGVVFLASWVVGSRTPAALPVTMRRVGLTLTRSSCKQQSGKQCRKSELGVRTHGFSKPHADLEPPLYFHEPPNPTPCFVCVFKLVGGGCFY